MQELYRVTICILYSFYYCQHVDRGFCFNWAHSHSEMEVGSASISTEPQWQGLGQVLACAGA